MTLITGGGEARKTKLESLRLQKCYYVYQRVCMNVCVYKSPTIHKECMLVCNLRRGGDMKFKQVMYISEFMNTPTKE